jgi:DNA recombination-dependent growth factor C
MGFTSATASVFRYVAPKPASFDRGAVAAAVTRRAFTPLAPEDGAARGGWVAIHDPLVTELGPADLFFQQYLAVGFRFDRRVVPAQLLRLERRRLERERAREQGVARLGARARREIKTEVETRLVSQALPAPRIVDCVWNLEHGRLYLSGGARTLREALLDLFRATFGVHPMPMIPYVAAEHVGLGAGTVTALRAVEPAVLAPGASTDRAGVPSLPIGLKELSS